MPDTVASELLRPGLLEGVSMLLAGADLAGEHTRCAGPAVASACAQLGARVSLCEAPAAAGGDAPPDESPVDEAVERALAAAGAIDLLAVDAGAFFAIGADDARAGGRTALRACLDGTWAVTRAVAQRAFLAHGRGGRIVFIAPASGCGEHAGAARAGLENLARTLSVEWARHGITVVAIAPGRGTGAGEVAALTAYLGSPAGAYFSGCVLDLSGPV